MPNLEFPLPPDVGVVGVGGMFPSGMGDVDGGELPSSFFLIRMCVTAVVLFGLYPPCPAGQLSCGVRGGWLGCTPYC